MADFLETNTHTHKGEGKNFWLISYNLHQTMAHKRNCSKIQTQQLNQQAVTKQTLNILNLKIKKQPQNTDYTQE